MSTLVSLLLESFAMAGNESFWQCSNVCVVFDLKNNAIATSLMNSPSTVGAFELLNDLEARQSNITLVISRIVVVFKHVMTFSDSKQSVRACESEHSERLHEIESCNP